MVEEEGIMDNEQLQLLKQIMEISFVLIETTLYLDTHPTDERALRIHNKYSQEYKELVDLYESKYGLLTYIGMSGSPWSYINSPWPWEIDYSLM